MMPVRSRSPLMSLSDAMEALGDDGMMGSYTGEIPLASVVGSAARRDDFDAEFRLVNPALRGRYSEVSRAFAAGSFPPPLDLVRLGELYFVRDGHHRVSVARSLGWDSLPARVTQVCTVAYAMCCLRAAHLNSKAAERRFLQRVPLPDDVRRDLWLDEPADWMRLADAADAWAHRERGAAAGEATGHDLATAWWYAEVRPVLDRLRAHGVGLALRDIQLYVTALGVRDSLGRFDWPDDLVARLETGKSCCSLPR
ncbi:MAG TPA: hypothetical protein VFJ19_16575 [Nocardioidaceae bacterium]|nr:hypothetical protein [Nocardioidaceae bacterium]